MINHRSRLAPVVIPAVTGDDFTKTPATASDGAEVPLSHAGYRPARLLLSITATASGTVFGGAVKVWSYSASDDRWVVVGKVNDGDSIDAQAGLEDVLDWYGGSRIAVTATSIVNGPVTVSYSRIEESS
jgi:hypothetical protein